MNSLKSKLEKALANENYEEADKIQEQMLELQSIYEGFFDDEHEEEVKKYLKSFKNK